MATIATEGNQVSTVGILEALTTLRNLRDAAPIRQVADTIRDLNVGGQVVKGKEGLDFAEFLLLELVARRSSHVSTFGELPSDQFSGVTNSRPPAAIDRKLLRQREYLLTGVASGLGPHNGGLESENEKFPMGVVASAVLELAPRSYELKGLIALMSLVFDTADVNFRDMRMIVGRGANPEAGLAASLVRSIPLFLANILMYDVPHLLGHKIAAYRHENPLLYYLSAIEGHVGAPRLGAPWSAKLSGMGMFDVSQPNPTFESANSGELMATNETVRAAQAIMILTPNWIPEIVRKELIIVYRNHRSNGGQDPKTLAEAITAMFAGHLKAHNNQMANDLVAIMYAMVAGPLTKVMGRFPV